MRVLSIHYRTLSCIGLLLRVEPPGRMRKQNPMGVVQASLLVCYTVHHTVAPGSSRCLYGVYCG